MGKLTYEEFVNKYIQETINSSLLKEIKDDSNSLDSEMIDMIIESVSNSFYQDYLNDKLDFIEEEDRIKNDDKNNNN